MAWTAFVEFSYYWAYWTLFEAMWIGMLWFTRSRVPGRAVCWIPGVRAVRRRACEMRVDALLAGLGEKGVPAADRPDRTQLVDRWHRFVAGRCAAVPFQATPLLIAWAPFLPLRAAPEGTPLASLWMFVALAGYGTVSIALMAADVRAVAVSDAAGLATTKAALFLEVLVLPGRQRSQDSALDTQAKAFRQLCRALRAQAKYTACEMPATTRERVRQDTERLIAALGHLHESYLLSEGEERSTAVGEMARLVSNALQHSCGDRDQRNSLVVVSAHLLADAPAPVDAALTTADPRWHRMLRGVGWLVAAAALFTGAAVFPSGGAATDMMAVMGLLSVAAVFPPLRELLGRATAGLFGTSMPSVEPGTGPHPPPRTEAPAPMATRADEARALCGSGPAGCPPCPSCFESH
ncbi:hypothetical protein ACIPJK_08315 [Streptomyces roseus]|uniref:hypothetical protein n=1 Tax=Streptomyces roseus TaxID=66430 RepID=UPI00382303A5